ncbi:MAG: hypothetical protein V3R71_08125 [Gemmatimonadales bacterium]
MSKEYATKFILLYEQCLSEGYKVDGTPAALREAGRRMKPARKVDNFTFNRIKDLYGIEPDWSQYQEKEYAAGSKVTAPAAPVIVVKPTYKIARPAGRGPKTKILIAAIGDAHDGPGVPDKSRFRWAGKHIKTIRHDCVLQIGDMFTLDSVSRFNFPGSLEGKEAPFWKDDMASGKEALDTFQEGLGGYKVDRHCTMGNHEDRYASQIGRQPWALDALKDTPHTILGDRGWTYSPYGEFHFIGHTGFVHVPLNRMGKPFGGKFSENQIGNESVFDVVYGHSHRPLVKPFPKLNNETIKVVNLGCFLPDGHVEPYAKHSLHGWEYGLYDITLLGGRISKANWVPMAELEERYG